MGGRHDGRGARPGITYDTAGNGALIQRTVSGTTATSALAYNAMGEVVSQDDGAGTIYFAYDRAGRLVGQNIVPTRGGLPGAQVMRAVQNGQQIHCNGQGFIDRIGERGGPASVFTGYTADGLPRVTTLPGGVSEERAYGPGNVLNSMTVKMPAHAGDGPESYASFTYGYDLQGHTRSIHSPMVMDTTARACMKKRLAAPMSRVSLNIESTRFPSASIALY